MARYDRGIVLDKTDAPSVLAEISKFAEEVCHIDEMPVREEKILFLGEEISFCIQISCRASEGTALMSGICFQVYPDG